MRRKAWTSAHERLVAGTAPRVEEPGDVEVDRIWREVQASSSGPSRAPRSPRRLAAGALVGALLLGSASVATAQLYSAYTGRGPIDGEDRRLGGPGERLDPAAPDFAEVVEEQTADIVFPTSTSRDVALRSQVEEGRRAEATTSTAALRAWVADAAVCAWSNQWAAAVRRDDVTAREEALEVIVAAPTWPAVTALDPSPSNRWISQQVQDASGAVRTERFRDPSPFFYLERLGRAAQSNDVPRVAGLLAANNGQCRPALVPDLPSANANVAAQNGG